MTIWFIQPERAFLRSISRIIGEINGFSGYAPLYNIRRSSASVWTEGDSGEFFLILPKFDLFAKKKSIMNKYI